MLVAAVDQDRTHEPALTSPGSSMAATSPLVPEGTPAGVAPPDVAPAPPPQDEAPTVLPAATPVRLALPATGRWTSDLATALLTVPKQRRENTRHLPP